MLHACVQKFNVTKNLEKFCKILRTKQSLCFTFCDGTRSRCTASTWSSYPGPGQALPCLFTACTWFGLASVIAKRQRSIYTNKLLGNLEESSWLLQLTKPSPIHNQPCQNVDVRSRQKQKHARLHAAFRWNWLVTSSCSNLRPHRTKLRQVNSNELTSVTSSITSQRRSQKHI